MDPFVESKWVVWVKINNSIKKNTSSKGKPAESSRGNMCRPLSKKHWFPLVEFFS